MIVTSEAVCSEWIGLELHAGGALVLEDRLLASPAPAPIVPTAVKG
jgi:hypothetical protein